MRQILDVARGDVDITGREATNSKAGLGVTNFGYGRLVDLVDDGGDDGNNKDNLDEDDGEGDG